MVIGVVLTAAVVVLKSVSFGGTTEALGRSLVESLEMAAALA